jgi:hypothetical protein
MDSKPITINLYGNFMSATRGHLKLFERLAQWLSDGNQLIITKGNHDLEWYWKEVRNYLQYWFGNIVAEKKGAPIEDVISKIIKPKILFVDDALVIDNRIYVEHGHRYENTTNVKVRAADSNTRKN